MNEQLGISDCAITHPNSPGNSASDARVDAVEKSASPAGRQLCEQVIQILRATGYLSLRDLDVFTTEGIVILRGKVPSYYLKQLSQAVVLELPRSR